MATDETIGRINELYKKQKAEGLTEEEKEEQKKLRSKYINSIKENLRSQLENIEVVSPEEYEKRMKGHEHEHNCNCHEHHN
mgnify:CR=1 FL=1